ncbi:nucleoside hydrolase (plasmid) [Rhizobium sp. B230/85]|uniref:nucleoside hydrolase n=1 Tax=unclassified Rhizobium TaxID=2613769 RepID=UPI001ADD4BEF|nr:MULTISPECIES: nucleoside hydrolase [unclassified Rhizobium]MBO9136925.1 nucleoside hydrolase [Rhizobium sp. B209b/85]QXZ99817.1 nucleoside hydrolase [Rhizobium sp. B230/85]
MRTGYGGSRTTTSRFGGTASTASALGGILEGMAQQPAGSPPDPALLSGRTMIAGTCVAGNVGLESVVNNARRIFELCERRDIPVYSGAARPIMASRGGFSIMHGSDGLAGSRLPAPTMPLANGHAANEISRIAWAEGKLNISATGPLTNIALAVLLDPKLPEFISALSIMGGAAFCPGKRTSLVEFNFAVDSHAAAIVFDRSPITMVGLDVAR